MTQQYTATAVLSDNTEVPLTDNLSWFSTDAVVASIDATGLATMLTVGVTEIKVEFLYDGVVYTGSADLEVRDAEFVIERIQVDPASSSILVGAQQSYTATAILVDAPPVVITEDVSWVSSDSNIASIDGPGLATGQSPGNVQITATLNLGDDTFADSAELEVLSDAVVIDEILVTPSVATVSIGDQVAYTATALLSDGSNLDVTSVSTWQSSDSSIAFVGGDGVAEGVSEGQVQISASYTLDGVLSVGTARLAVRPPDFEILRLEVEPADAGVLIGDIQAYTATAVPVNGDPFDVTGDVLWESSDPAIAAMSGNVATGLEEGSVIIKAIYNFSGGSAEGVAALSVLPAEPEIVALEIAPETAALFAGDTQQYTALVRLDDGSTVPVEQLNWGSSDGAVASISAGGLATALAEGSTTITGTFFYEGETYTDTASLSVSAIPLLEITVSPASATVVAGLQQQFMATAVYQDDSTADITSQASWGSSDTSVATINGFGLATTLIAGTTTITADFGGKTGSASLTATAATLVDIQILPGSVTGAAGSQVNLRLLATYSNGFQEEVTTQATWSSDTPDVASVVATGAQAGLLTLKTVGTATVSADFGGLNRSIPVEVTAALLEELVISPLDAFIAAGVELQYTAFAIYSDGSNQNVTNQTQWSSGTPETASIDSTGLALGATAGTTTISAEFEGLTKSTTLTVTAAVLESIVILPGPVEGPAGTDSQLTLQATYSDSQTADVTQSATWTSLNSAVASVVATGSDAGLVSLLAAGSTDVRASFGGLQTDVPVTVTEPALIKLTVTPLVASVAAGLTQQYAATAEYNNGDIVDVTGSAAWTSSDTSVASVEPGGLATGIAAGSTVISALFFEVSAVADLEVTAATLVSVQVDPPSATVPVGTAGQLRLYARFSDDSQQDVTASATWQSSDETVVSIVTSGTDAGIATAMGVGNAMVSGTYQSLSSDSLIEVTQAELVELQITPRDTEVPLGNALAYAAQGIFSDGSNQDLTDQVNWGSSNTAVAAIDNDGVANTYSEGVTDISASLPA